MILLPSAPSYSKHANGGNILWPFGDKAAAPKALLLVRKGGEERRRVEVDEQRDRQPERLRQPDGSTISCRPNIFGGQVRR